MIVTNDDVCSINKMNALNKGLYLVYLWLPITLQLEWIESLLVDIVVNINNEVCL